VKPIHTKNRRIGLLGGSFNPAHEGHLHLTLEAIKTLKLDEVWWLVSPKNPLKSSADLAPYKKRLELARAICDSYPHILVSDIESRMGTLYSVDTVAMLKRRFPGTTFIWLMGADNLAQLHRYRRWRTFLAQVPIAVFDRAPYSHTAIRSKAYLRMQRFLLKNNVINRVFKAPALVFVHMKRHPLSSTALRKRLENARF
jgi:nicotinate-nucleotide adenylyltransferase